MNIDGIKKYLMDYDGPEVNIMEVCGSHTATIAKNGIKSMLSENIHLISGPGCPVCVTTSSYVDKLIELAETDNTCVVTFGDMIRIPGSKYSLRDVGNHGARVEMVYSPMDTIKLAKKENNTTFVFAAVGFETTAPAYALLLERLIAEDIKNVKLLTALKRMPPVIDWLCAGGAKIDGFIAPGHVSVITGSDAFIPIAEKYRIPFAVAGFEGEDVLMALYCLIKSRDQSKVMNLYPQVVNHEGSLTAKEKLDKYFESCDAGWRGMGTVHASGIALKKKYDYFDAGSHGLVEDRKLNIECMCGAILAGKAETGQCPLFVAGKCTPEKPQGACMVSFEGSCYQNYINGEHR